MVCSLSQTEDDLNGWVRIELFDDAPGRVSPFHKLLHAAIVRLQFKQGIVSKLCCLMVFDHCVQVASETITLTYAQIDMGAANVHRCLQNKGWNR